MSTGQGMKAVQPLPVRTWSLRVVLVISLLLFSLLPATTVGWLLYRNNLQTVTALAERIVQDLALKVQVETETYLSLAHTVLNGLAHERATESALLRARQSVGTIAGDNADQDAGIKLVLKAVEAPLRASACRGGCRGHESGRAPSGGRRAALLRRRTPG